MKFQDKERKHSPFDAPAGMEALLKSQGFHEIIEVKPEPEIPVRWWVARGTMAGDFEHAPYIVCRAGENTTCIESQNGTAHKSAKIRTVDGRMHTCPEHIGRQYEELFAAWKAKSKKRPAQPIVSQYTPKRILDAQGVQLSAWQIAELRNK